jgi:arylsulfatase A-like enzyme
LIGKYLNGAPPLIPKPQGWDTWLQITGVEEGQQALDYEVCDGTTTTTASVFQLDFLLEAAAAFVGDGEPWFLLLAPTVPHFPFSPDPRDLFAWSDVQWPLVNEEDVSDKPSWIRRFPPLSAAALNRFRATARAQLREATSLDRIIGRLLTGMTPRVLDNTTVIYCSDNGLEYGEHRRPFNGITKFAVYDVSMRVPLVIRGPGIPTGISAQPVTMAADLTTTILGMAGASAGLPGDGVDLRDVIENPEEYEARQLLHEKGVTTEFGTGPAGHAITTSTRKLWRFPTEQGTDRFEAYDLDTDPDELENWANDPARLAERNTLERALDALLDAP